MYDFKVYPGVSMKELDEKTTHIIIAINSPEDIPWPVRKNEYCQDVLDLYFNDIDHQKINEKLMDEHQADKILDFVLEHRDVDTIVVHCNAGMSRSPAVAAVLAYIFNNEKDTKYTKQYIPNKHVYNTILKRAFERDLLNI